MFVDEKVCIDLGQGKNKVKVKILILPGPIDLHFIKTHSLQPRLVASLIAIEIKTYNYIIWAKLHG